jgi:hypothetical protein
MIASFQRNGRVMMPISVNTPTNAARNVLVSSGTKMNWNNLILSGRRTAGNSSTANRVHQAMKREMMKIDLASVNSCDPILRVILIS